MLHPFNRLPVGPQHIGSPWLFVLIYSGPAEFGTVWEVDSTHQRVEDAFRVSFPEGEFYERF